MIPNENGHNRSSCFNRKFLPFTYCLNCIANETEELNQLTIESPKTADVDDKISHFPSASENSTETFPNQRDRLIQHVEKFINIANNGFSCDSLFFNEEYERLSFLFKIYPNLEGFDLTFTSQVSTAERTKYSRTVMFNKIQNICTGSELFTTPKYAALMVYCQKDKQLKSILENDLDNLLILEFLDEDDILQRLFLIFYDPIDQAYGNETCADLFSVIFQVLRILNTMDNKS